MLRSVRFYISVIHVISDARFSTLKQPLNCSTPPFWHTQFPVLKRLWANKLFAKAECNPFDERQFSNVKALAGERVYYVQLWQMVLDPGERYAYFVTFHAPHGQIIFDLARDVICSSTKHFARRSHPNHIRNKWLFAEAEHIAVTARIFVIFTPCIDKQSLIPSRVFTCVPIKYFAC